MYENSITNLEPNKEVILQKYASDIEFLRQEVTKFVTDRSKLVECNNQINSLENEYKKEIEEAFTSSPNSNFKNSALSSYQDIFNTGKEIILRKVHLK